MSNIIKKNQTHNKGKSGNKYKVNQIKLPITHTLEELENKIIKHLRIQPTELVSFDIIKKSIDARKKPQIFYTYTVVVELVVGKSLKKPLPNVEAFEEVKYKLPEGICETKSLSSHESKLDSHPNSESKENTSNILSIGSQNLPPVIVGTGPAGLFCGYILAKAGLPPILLERGADVDQRISDVESFWDTGILNLESNVQFGEGGAGTFSDGKLNTLVKDKLGRNKFVLETLVEHGAPKEILYEQKPHVGTDILAEVVKNIRLSIENLGGKVYFNTKLVDISLSNISLSDNKIKGHDNRAIINQKKGTVDVCGEIQVVTSISDCNVVDNPLKGRTFSTNHLVLAIGHSARDTFEMLYNKEINMSAKSFAVGLRIEHTQEMINQSQYGVDYPKSLPAASYKLTHNLPDGRGVYSFCMCPGGYVVNASSEEESLAINGMSYHKRDGDNANSAAVVTVTPDDFPSNHPLSGVEFQRNLERKAYEIGNGKVPVQSVGDFLASDRSTLPESNCNNDESALPESNCTSEILTSIKNIQTITPSIKGEWQYANLHDLFPENITSSLAEGIINMDKKIKGFASSDALLSGVESRTSSPVKIHRDESCQSNIKGIYPCGEGAGYAGGITSAAMDGMKVAEAIITFFA
jgi:uncharacterized FAD-dependent dehydrogenase